jgi:hypothetical protein
MSDASNTPFSSKAEILAEFWMDYREDEKFKEFVEYSDLGLPLAYAIAENIVTVSDKAKQYVEEAFDVFLSTVGIEDDGFSSLEELLEFAEASKNILDQ